MTERWGRRRKKKAKKRSASKNTRNADLQMNTEEKLLWRRDMHRYSQKMTEIQRKILQKRPPEERKKKKKRSKCSKNGRRHNTTNTKSRTHWIFWLDEDRVNLKLTCITQKKYRIAERQGKKMENIIERHRLKVMEPTISYHFVNYDSLHHSSTFNCSSLNWMNTKLKLDFRPSGAVSRINYNVAITW